MEVKLALCGSVIEAKLKGRKKMDTYIWRGNPRQNHFCFNFSDTLAVQIILCDFIKINLYYSCPIWL